MAKIAARPAAPRPGAWRRRGRRAGARPRSGWASADRRAAGNRHGANGGGLHRAGRQAATRASATTCRRRRACGRRPALADEDVGVRRGARSSRATRASTGGRLGPDPVLLRIATYAGLAIPHGTAKNISHQTGSEARRPSRGPAKERSMADQRVVIAGGGIAGLTLALALARGSARAARLPF